MKNIVLQILFYLKVSRPGLWFATIWLYLLPTSNNFELLQNISFWLGFFYVCFPLNFMVYGWNDIVDFETDQINPRKDSFLFGAKATKFQLKNLWKAIFAVQLFCIPFLVWFSNVKILLVIFCFAIINFLYNKPKNGLRSKPPFELLCQIGYLLIVPFSIIINQATNLSFAAYFYLFLFCVQSHLIGEVMDFKPDKLSGRKTTATEIGIFKTKLLIIFIVLAEVLLLAFYFGALYFSLVLVFGLIWLLLDLFLINKTKNYTLQEMKFFAFGSNILGFATIIYVWLSATLK